MRRDIHNDFRPDKIAVQSGMNFERRDEMNVVFWLLILLVAIAVWWLLSPLFGEIGKWFKNESEDLKTELNDEWEENEE